MFTSISDELQLLLKRFNIFYLQIFYETLLNVGFVKRTSKYQAKDLVALIGSLGTGEASLVAAAETQGISKYLTDLAKEKGEKAAIAY